MAQYFSKICIRRENVYNRVSSRWKKKTKLSNFPRERKFDEKTFDASYNSKRTYLRQFFFTHPLQILKGNYGNFHKRAQQQGTTETREVGERLLHGGCYLFDLRVQSSWREAIGGATVAYQPFSARSAARFGCCSMQTARSFAGRALCTTARIYTRYYCDIVSPPPLPNLCKTKFEITPRGRPSSAAPRNLFVNFRSNIYSTRLDWKANSRVHGWKIISRPGGCSTV